MIRNGQIVQEYTNEIIKQNNSMRICPNNSNIFLQYLGGLPSDLTREVVLPKPKTIYEVYVKAHYFKIDKMNLHLSGCKQINQ